MGYAEGLMSTGERIVHREKQHWFVFIWGARYTLLAIVIAGIGAVVQTNLSSPWREILGWAAAILFIGGLLLLGWTILRYMNQEYVLTNRRVVEVEGVLNKRVTDSSLEKVNDIVLTQSIFGRIFGFGDLEILTASETGISRFRMLVQPVKFKREMLDAKHEYERDIAGSGYVTSPPFRAESYGGGPLTDDTVSTPLPPAAPAQPLSRDEVTQTLNSLADLRDRGAISPEEFERKKADLLARL
ncbi:MAG TPA: PH domain-containing protein [Candidatus Limnocylindrales bacterium]|nr:PH domain-containing protein [Candidatus Limnocylindrales bacterium]